MTYRDELLRDDYTFEQAEVIQIKYQRLIKNSRVNEDIIDTSSIKTIAGADVSYYIESDIEYGGACAVNLNIKNECVGCASGHQCTFPGVLQCFLNDDSYRDKGVLQIYFPKFIGD